MRKQLLLLIFLLATGSLQAQNIAIGQWRAHLPQSDPLRLFYAHNHVYAWTSHGFMRYNLENAETRALSTVEGFSEVGISYAAWHKELNIVLIAYQNSNIDLILPDGSIYNVPDLLNASVNGSKEVFKVDFYGPYAFISCGFGILVYNLERKESSAEYKSNLITNVKSTLVFNGQVYAATSKGLYKAPLPVSGISIPANQWSFVDSGEYHDMLEGPGKIFLWHDSTVSEFDGNIETVLLQNKHFRSMTSQDDERYLTTDSGIFLLHSSQLDFHPLQGSMASIRLNGDWFYASQGFGLIRLRSNGNMDFLSPKSPFRAGSGAMSGFGNVLYIGGGGMYLKGGTTFTYNGYYMYREGEWSNSIGSATPYLDQFYDIHAVCVDPKSGTLWVSGFEKGLLELAGTQVLNYFDASNSPLKLGLTAGITSLKMDEKRNLWVANFSSGSPLLVRSADGHWDSFPAISSQATYVLEVVIDQKGQKWLRFTDGVGAPSAGILVYDDKGTPSDKSDDPYPTGKILSAQAGSGALPDNQVNCMAVDRNGQIWVGTEKGLAVFQNPSNILSTNPSDARRIVVGSGDNVGYLLGDESISAILVDGGNRKWIASRSGLWLVSPDGQEIIAHYNAENSPLFTNEILALGMIESSGELMIATDKGLISLGTGSSKAEDRHGVVKVYPNPVRPGYTGEIAISGLPEDAFVKITDIAGNVVFETRAVGGTATWNALRPDGSRAASGVYLIFSGNQDGSDTFVSKLLIVN